ncbi:SgcJ/EcaC family oxidoreductase [Serratia bockelmannii]|uniref:SgcJ/EcaC family oxidoreductase n=1 Tax=Serratia bockelmannii TaxID=2703793 RepID=UPI00313E40F2
MKKIPVTVTLLLLCAFKASVVAGTASDCVRVNRHQIEALFEQWNQSLQTGDVKKVTDNYLSDAVLLPTLSGKARMTQSERTDYFRHFLEKKPHGKIDSRTIRIGCNYAIDTGMYTFTFLDKSEVSARYTFTYLWTGS